MKIKLTDIPQEIIEEYEEPIQTEDRNWEEEFYNLLVEIQNDNQPKQLVNVESRYGNIYPLEKVEEFLWCWHIPSDNHCRRGYDNDPEDIIFVDPEGGPMISIGTNLKFIHNDLPEEFVELIHFDNNCKAFVLKTTNIEKS